MSRRREVVITGMGIISSLGTGLDSHWQHLVKKATGIRQVTQGRVATPLQYAGRVEVSGLPPDAPDALLKQERLMSPSSLLGLWAVDEAVRQSGLDLLQIRPGRKALYIGAGDYTKVGYHDYYPALQDARLEDGKTIDYELLNRATLHKVNPFVLLEWLTNNLVAFVSLRYKVQGPNTILASHSPCGGQALELAIRSLVRGDADVAIVVGACCWVTPIPLFEMDTLGLLSQCRDGARSFRPFDRRRDGFIAGEGAAALVLETSDLARGRDATILGTILGFGDFTEVSRVGGLGLPMEACEQAMAMALKEADCLPKDLSFICPHGNGTRKGDRSELTAITRLLGSDRASVVVCGLKSYTGHMGAASDIAEIALGLTALKNGLVPATLNFEKAEGGFEELQVVGDHRQVTGTRFLSLSQGFGGQSVAVVVSL